MTRTRRPDARARNARSNGHGPWTNALGLGLALALMPLVHVHPDVDHFSSPGSQYHSHHAHGTAPPAGDGDHSDTTSEHDHHGPDHVLGDAAPHFLSRLTAPSLHDRTIPMATDRTPSIVHSTAGRIPSARNTPSLQDRLRRPAAMPPQDDAVLCFANSSPPLA